MGCGCSSQHVQREERQGQHQPHSGHNAHMNERRQSSVASGPCSSYDSLCSPVANPLELPNQTLPRFSAATTSQGEGSEESNCEYAKARTPLEDSSGVPPPNNEVEEQSTSVWTGADGSETSDSASTSSKLIPQHRRISPSTSTTSALRKKKKQRNIFHQNNNSFRRSRATDPSGSPTTETSCSASVVVNSHLSRQRQQPSFQRPNSQTLNSSSCNNDLFVTGDDDVAMGATQLLLEGSDTYSLPPLPQAILEDSQPVATATSTKKEENTRMAAEEHHQPIPQALQVSPRLAALTADGTEEPILLAPITPLGVQEDTADENYQQPSEQHPSSPACELILTDVNGTTSTSRHHRGPNSGAASLAPPTTGSRSRSMSPFPLPIFLNNQSSTTISPSDTLGVPVVAPSQLQPPAWMNSASGSLLDVESEGPPLMVPVGGGRSSSVLCERAEDGDSTSNSMFKVGDCFERSSFRSNPGGTGGSGTGSAVGGDVHLPFLSPKSANSEDCSTNTRNVAMLERPGFGEQTISVTSLTAVDELGETNRALRYGAGGGGCSRRSVLSSFQASPTRRISGGSVQWSLAEPSTTTNNDALYKWTAPHQPLNRAAFFPSVDFQSFTQEDDRQISSFSPSSGAGLAYYFLERTSSSIAYDSTSQMAMSSVAGGMMGVSRGGSGYMAATNNGSQIRTATANPLSSEDETLVAPGGGLEVRSDASGHDSHFFKLPKPNLSTSSDGREHLRDNATETPNNSSSSSVVSWSSRITPSIGDSCDVPSSSFQDVGAASDVLYSTLSQNHYP